MRKTILVIALLCYTLTSALAQKLTLVNNSCGDVFIRLHADDNSGCGPMSVDELDAIYLAAGNSIAYSFTGTIGTNSAVGGNFVWISTGTAGTPSATLSGPPSSFNFFKADVWSSCAPGGWPVSGGTCQTTSGGGGFVPYDGGTIYNPNCGSFSAQFVTSVPCGSCDFCGTSYLPCGGIPPCVVVHDGVVTNYSFTTSGGDWSVTVY